MHDAEQVVREYFAAFNAGDPAACAAMWSDDIELHPPVDLPDNAVRHGRREVTVWFQGWFDLFGTDYEFEVLEVEGRGNTAAAVVRHHGRGRSSGAAFGESVGYVFRLDEEGKIALLAAFRTYEEALASARTRRAGR